MKVNEYTIDIYHPNSSGSVWVSFTSDTPFLPINTGDYVSPTFTYNQNQSEPAFESSGSGLRVTKVEHLITSCDGDNISHKVIVFTEESDNPWNQNR